MLDGAGQTELEEVLTLGRWRLGTHLQTQRAAQWRSSVKPIGTIASGFHSDWFTYWVTRLRPESGGGQTSRGQRLEVGWGSRVGVAGGVTLCADTYEFLGFLSPRLSGFGLFGRTKRTEVLLTEGLWKVRGREERRPLGGFGGCSPLTDGLAGLTEGGECAC